MYDSRMLVCGAVTINFIRKKISSYQIITARKDMVNIPRATGEGYVRYLQQPKYKSHAGSEKRLIAAVVTKSRTRLQKHFSRISSLRLVLFIPHASALRGAAAPQPAISL